MLLVHYTNVTESAGIVKGSKCESLFHNVHKMYIQGGSQGMMRKGVNLMDAGMSEKSDLCQLQQRLFPSDPSYPKECK